VLSPFAAKSVDAAKTRLITEEEHAYRTAFQRDRDRIIHSRAFRRLKHKRQVFLVTYGDHYRTRITHTIEVSQLSRTMARALGLNEDLVEAIALGHDLGHTPFGHIGEVVLHRIMKGHDDLDGALHMTDAGGFKHNYQSVRIVDYNEMKYGFRGLNLTAPVREGILKHTRLRRNDVNIPGFEKEGLYYDLDHATTLEGQIVAVCDEIAQRTHDLEDGLRARHVSLLDVRSLELIKLIEQRFQLAAVFEQENGFPFSMRKLSGSASQSIRCRMISIVLSNDESLQKRRKSAEIAKRKTLSEIYFVITIFIPIYCHGFNYKNVLIKMKLKPSFKIRTMMPAIKIMWRA